MDAQQRSRLADAIHHRVREKLARGGNGKE